MSSGNSRKALNSLTEVLVVVGDPSGDGYAADVVRALKLKIPSVRFVGVGGPLMEAEGVHTLVGLEKLAVMGFREVVQTFDFFRELERRIHALILEVDLVLLVDFPGFNMRIARLATACGRPVLYYIPPKVWASRPGRAAELARVSDHIAVIFPFEVDALSDAGAEVSYVGNPLLDRPNSVTDRSRFHRSFNLNPDRPILALLPGSREQEIKEHLQLFVEAAELVIQSCPDVQPVISKAKWLNNQLFQDAPFPLIDDSRGLLQHARAGLVKSGTATLEAALEETPLVVAYRTSRFSWSIVKRMLRVKHVSLVNLLAEDSVVPELIQGNATPENIAHRLIPLMDENSPERKKQIYELSRIAPIFGSFGSAGRVADLAIKLLSVSK